MPTDSLAISGILFAVWLLWLWRSGWLRHQRLETEIRPPHAVQLVLQLCIYVYWSFYWDEVGHRAQWIAGQIAFACLFEMCLAMTRGRPWRLRLAPFPVIFSINLFLWFRDEVFYLQLLVVAFAYLAKEFLTWQRNGRRSHIFNPSAFPLA